MLMENYKKENIFVTIIRRIKSGWERLGEADIQESSVEKLTSAELEELKRIESMGTSKKAEAKISSLQKKYSANVSSKAAQKAASYKKEKYKTIEEENIKE